MSKTKTIKQALAELFALAKKEIFLDAKAADGSILRTPDDAFKTGSQVMLISEDGTTTPVVDGSYTLEDGSCLVIKSGAVESIVAATGTGAPAKADDATSANPTLDAPAKMDGECGDDVDCTDPENADCPVCQDAMAAVPAPVDGKAPEQAMGIDDVQSMIELVKNLVDRVSKLEEEVSGTKMSVEKMAKAPAAKAFNSASAPKGTVAEYLENYKKEYKAEKKRKEEAALKLKGGVKQDSPMQFSQTPKQGAATTTNKKIDLDWGRLGNLSGL